MAVDISEYLKAITGEDEGEEVIQAIHDAALLLGTEMYTTADISELLEEIKTKPFGKDIRYCIYEILKRLSEAEPRPGPESTSAVYGDVSVILGVTGAFGTDAVYGEATREEE